MTRAVVVGVLFSIASCAAASPEIWLARSPECNSCDIFEQVARDRGYGDTLRYREGGTRLSIPILEVDKGSLDAEILAQLPEEAWQDPGWTVMLTVLVVDDGRVLSFGNIADSADTTELRHPDAVMFPPAVPADDDPSLVEGDLYRPFFIANWNLEYFVDVALGRRPPRARARLVDLASPRPLNLDPANVVFWGSAGTPLANALFIPTRIREIRSRLESLPGLERVHYWTLYGNGPDMHSNDTSYIVDGKTRFREEDLPADLAADGEGLNRLFTAIHDESEARSLLIQVGHSGPAGSPLWGAGLTLGPWDLGALKDSGADLVMVSGACYGGMFAKVAQCGFFAAHPQVIASGCQLSPEALLNSDDYLRLFFEAATNAQPASVPVNGRRGRAATMSEAHWWATSRLEDHQISYTSSDAVIDDYFEAHPEALPATLTVAEIRRLAGALSGAESSALDSMTVDLPSDLAVTLTRYLDLNREAEAKLVGATELSSEERNRITDMPYRLALPLLARRALYESLSVDDPEFAAVSACEGQSIPEFLGGD